MTVRVERAGPVTTIILARPSVKNAVDRATADALSAAFLAFDADASAHVAVLYGEGGVFCAGADLTAFSRGEGNRIAPDGDAPLGPSRMLLSKPVIAAVEVTPLRAASSSRSSATCASRTNRPCSESSAGASAFP